MLTEVPVLAGLPSVHTSPCESPLLWHQAGVLLQNSSVCYFCMFPGKGAGRPPEFALLLRWLGCKSANGHNLAIFCPWGFEVFVFTESVDSVEASQRYCPYTQGSTCTALLNINWRLT